LKPLIAADVFDHAKAAACLSDTTSRECLRADIYRDRRLAFNTEKDFYSKDAEA